MKIAFISDTHGFHGRLGPAPDGIDLLIHCGDFMNGGKSYIEILEFNSWLGELGFPTDKILVCAGNHDILFDEYHIASSPEQARESRRLLNNCVYLQDESVTIKGVKFYFSPWTPFFMGWGFNVNRGAEIKEFWDKIPEDTNVLVTHGPPYGILDQPLPGRTDNVGCEDLGYRISSLTNLKYHAFGHIHGSRGIHHPKSYGLQQTTFINASFLDERYRPHPGSGYTIVEI